MAGEAVGGVGKRVQSRVLVELPGKDMLASQPRAGLRKLREFLAHTMRRPMSNGLPAGAAID